MNKNNHFVTAMLGLSLLFPALSRAQTQTEALPKKLTLNECITYALGNQPGVKQSVIDEQIGERDIQSALSGWLPQVVGSGSYNYNLKQQVSVIGGNEVVFGQKNTSAIGVQADQAILDASLVQASKAAKWSRLQYKQNTENTKINTVVEVSKAFYDILTSMEQLNITTENIARLQKQLADAKSQYGAGLVDKTDFLRAQISISNALAEKKRTLELLKFKQAFLKQLMGYPSEANIDLEFNKTSMEDQVLLDTVQQLNYQNRIEYKLVETQKQLQHINTSYNKWNFIPKISGFINYNLNYQDNTFSNLYNKDYPSSVAGLKMTVPIFQGTKRIQALRKSQLQEKRLDLELANTKNVINTQYQQALATYKANLNDWKTAKQNVIASKEVYTIIKLQYDEGVKTYLDLMTADTDLRTTQINYLNALYNLLSGKLDVEKALGTVTINQ